MIRKEITEGSVIPKFYAPAYDKYEGYGRLFTVVCYLIPLNFIVGWSRRLITWLVLNTIRASERDLMKHEIDCLNNQIVELKKRGHIK
ncbi:MAG: hypothetical protein KKF27_22095 [Gammaproteobacteria bacterium]|nr:hypothetical protein [Gammaproteobacteria bacterium]